jgi:molybdopterin synthase sulfur carrier subunit
VDVRPRWVNVAANESMTPVSITVHIPGPLRDCCAGAAELALPATSLRAVLAELERRHPALHRRVCDETGVVRRHVNLFVNTHHMRDRNGLDTPLAPGDEVTILPAVSGG